MTQYSALDSPNGFQGNRRFTLGNSRQTARTHPISNQVVGRQGEAESPHEKQRRRIAVACSRCRKRKIKCSGDPKNGQGCQNCRNSGADPSQCQFLRVSSSSVECVGEWACMIGNAPQYANRSSLGNYGISYGGHGTSMPAPLPLNRRMPSLWPYQYHLTPTSQDYCNYDLTPQEGICDTPYALHSGHSFLDATEQQSITPHLFGQDVSRQWTTSTAKQERSYSAVFESAPTITPYTSSGTSYATPQAPIQSIDLTSGFPSLGGLAKSLPHSSNPLVDRALPAPRTDTSQPSNISQIYTTSTTCPELFTQPPTTQSAVSWVNERPTIGPLADTPQAIDNISQSTLPATCHKSLSLPTNELGTFEYANVTPSTGSMPSREPISAAGCMLGMAAVSSASVREALLYSQTESSSATEPGRLRIPSAGSFSGSCEDSCSKRDSISSSITDATLLNVSHTYPTITQGRHNHVAKTLASRGPSPLANEHGMESKDSGVENSTNSSSNGSRICYTA